ncbi:pol-related protein [Clonorchis sinensis]|uniref:Pol-related protein n=1 Tax=Clonorchis sinensis TaxID=79923 RepID=G7YKB5_CLOSI|nr:pol-related protein [Clonorchis sinensis]
MWLQQVPRQPNVVLVLQWLLARIQKCGIQFVTCSSDFSSVTPSFWTSFGTTSVYDLRQRPYKYSFKSTFTLCGRLAILDFQRQRPPKVCRRRKAVVAGMANCVHMYFGRDPANAFVVILYGAYGNPLLECANEVVYSVCKKDLTLIERVQRAATKMVPGPKSVGYESRFSVFALFPMECCNPRRGLISKCALFEQRLANMFFTADPTNIWRRDGRKIFKPRAHSFIRQQPLSVRVVGERKPTNDKNKPVPGSLSKSLEPASQSVNSLTLMLAPGSLFRAIRHVMRHGYSGRLFIGANQTSYRYCCKVAATFPQCRAEIFAFSREVPEMVVDLLFRAYLSGERKPLISGFKRQEQVRSGNLGRKPRSCVSVRESVVLL